MPEPIYHIDTGGIVALRKKPYHVLYYIIGTYLSYLFGDMLVYWGIDKLIAAFWSGIMASYCAVIFSLEIAIGVGLVIVGFFFFSDG